MAPRWKVNDANCCCELSHAGRTCAGSMLSKEVLLHLVVLGMYWEQDDPLLYLLGLGIWDTGLRISGLWALLLGVVAAWGSKIDIDIPFLGFFVCFWNPSFGSGEWTGHHVWDEEETQTAVTTYRTLPPSCISRTLMLSVSLPVRSDRSNR